MIATPTPNQPVQVWYAAALPWPPSVNHYWVRTRNGGMRVSDKGTAFRLLVLSRAGRVSPTKDRLAVTLDLYPPDKRRRDIDNVCKATLDALAHAGVYADDSQIDDLHIRRGDVAPPGRVEVRIVRLEAA